LDLEIKFLQELSVLSRKERRQTAESRQYAYNIVLPGETFGEQDDLYAGVVVFDRVTVQNHGAATKFAKLGCKYIEYMHTPTDFLLNDTVLC
jgi:hypothetical protein